MNTILIIGNVGKDPEVRTASSGTKLAKFSVGVRRARNKEETDWFYVTVFGKTADYVEQYVKVGNKIAVRGSMQANKQEDKVYWQLVADEVSNLTYTAQPQKQDDYDPFADER